MINLKPYIRKVNRNKEKDKINDFIGRWAVKHHLIDYKGGKCCKCGETKPWKLSFHHTNQEEKTDILNRKCHISEKIKEVDKCILVCENCHREIHAEMKYNARQQRNKELCLLYKEETPCCKICNYKKCNSALEFHHKNPDEKDFGITKKLQLHSWKTIEDMHEYIKNELDKCDIYCANCHGEIHTDLKRYELYKEEIIKKSKIIHKIKRNKVDAYKVLELWDSGIHDKYKISKILKCSHGRVWEILKSNDRT